MAALTRDRFGVIHETVIEQGYLPVAADTTIHLGALVSTDESGNAVPAADAPDQTGKAVYLALERADNAGEVAGAVRVSVMKRGTALLPKGAITATARGSQAHVVDDQTVALSSTNNRAFGTIDDVRADVLAVRF